MTDSSLLYTKVDEVLMAVKPNNGTGKNDEADVISANEELDTFDYSHYLKKIWVVKEWDGGVYNYPFSFFITRIEDGVIEGEFSEGIVMPFFFSSSYSAQNGNTPNFEDIKDLPRANLLGRVFGGIAECQFSNEYGDVGSASLVFKENDEIDAVIDYAYVGFMNKEQYYSYLRGIYQDTCDGREYLEKLSPMEGNYSYRPYNISDIEGSADVVRMTSDMVDLDSWGSVLIVTALLGGRGPWFPVMFLTNEYDDILYEFSVSSINSTEILEVVVEDFDGDGLKDIRVTLGFVDYSSGVSAVSDIQVTFLQMDNGLFYDKCLSNEHILAQSGG